MICQQCGENIDIPEETCFCEICGMPICEKCNSIECLHVVHNFGTHVCKECFNTVSLQEYNLAEKEPPKLSARFKVMKRDGYSCQICGRTADDGVKLEVDHKTPKSQGGNNSLENLWTLCFECNRGKGTALL